jgi:serine protease
VPGTTTYPQVGAFRITSLSPNVVDTAGGTTVTISGRALPTTPTVRIGGTATGTIVTASTTRVTFRVPARAAGVYDVTVFAPDGRSTVLSNALTYAAEVGSPAPDDGTPVPAAPGGTAPGGTAPGGTAPGGTRTVPGGR